MCIYVYKNIVKFTGKQFHMYNLMFTSICKLILHKYTITHIHAQTRIHTCTYAYKSTYNNNIKFVFDVCTFYIHNKKKIFLSSSAFWLRLAWLPYKMQYPAILYRI